MTDGARQLLEQLCRDVMGLHGKVIRVEENQEKIMADLTQLTQADADLKAEVVLLLQDVATKLSADDPDIDAIATDIEAQVAALKAGDPLSVASGPDGSGDGSGPPVPDSGSAAPSS